MSATGGPDIVEDGLVLALDAANIKSFRGEPTANLVTSPKSITTGYSTNIPTLTNNVLLNFDNTLTAGLVSGSGFMAYTAASTTNGNKYTTSWYVKAGTNTTVSFSWGGAHQGNRTNFTFNLLTGVVSSLTLASGENYGVDNIGNSWWRVWYSSTLSSGNAYYPQLNNNSGTMYVGALQIEAKPYPTPFVNGTRGTTVATGGGWADRSGNANHGELVNGPTYDGSNLGSLVFDGVDDYIQIPYSTYWNTNVFGTATNFTLECWYIPNLFKNWDTLIEKSESSGWYSRSEGAAIWTNSTSIQGVFSSGVDSNPAGSNVIITYTTSELRWYHICFTGDGTTLRLYVDGIQRGGNASVSSRTVAVYNGNIGPRFGRRAYMNGKMSSVRLYTKGLTATEVLQNYNATKGRFGL